MVGPVVDADVPVAHHLQLIVLDDSGGRLVDANPQQAGCGREGRGQDRRIVFGIDGSLPSVPDAQG